tara:strand:+ start:457 stop:1113 length:657 start_codon:yes stop_codon:yes gene_type:complete
MKRTEILEIIVSNPQAIFHNASREAGKYSEYPTYFQVASTTPTDKSTVYVKSININTNEVVLDAEGKSTRDEEGRVVFDTRPLSERATIGQGRFQSMPTRLILKSDITEESFLADYLAREEAKAKQEADRQAVYDKAKAEIEELKELCDALGIINTASYSNLSYHGRVSLQFDGDSITRLVSALKSAVTETKCKHCDATDSYNFGQCISCDEQQEVRS